MAGTREFKCIEEIPWLRTLGRMTRPIHEGDACDDREICPAAIEADVPRAT